MNKTKVTEMTVSGNGHYMCAIIDDIEYKIKCETPCTWDNRDTFFQKLLSLIPDSYKESVVYEYNCYCEGLRAAEAEAEAFANLTDEERMALMQESFEE